MIGGIHVSDVCRSDKKGQKNSTSSSQSIHTPIRASPSQYLPSPPSLPLPREFLSREERETVFGGARFLLSSSVFESLAEGRGERNLQGKRRKREKEEKVSDFACVT